MPEVVDLSKSFGPQPVLRHLHLRVGPEIKVIIGLNGSGKSTLLKIIAGILPADEGKVLISGREVTTLPPETREVGYVPQQPALFGHLTVWHNLTYPLKPRARGKAKGRVWVWAPHGFAWFRPPRAKNCWQIVTQY